MKIEILYPEVGNLHGDSSNVKFLKLCLPEAEFIETKLTDTPAFTTQQVDMIYLGAMSESGQRRVIDHLLPYINDLERCINENVVMLFTGNAMEVLFQSIEPKNDSAVKGLGLIDFKADGDFHKRYNGFVYGFFGEFEVVGFKTQFTLAHGDNSQDYFFKTERGMGMDLENALEGIHRHNFFATYLVGPLLLLNPPFTKYLLTLLGVEDPQLPFEEELVAAYRKRLTEFHDSNLAVN